MSKPLDHEQMEGLARLLITLGCTITRKASTISMVLEKGSTTPKIVKVQGWLSVTDEDLSAHEVRINHYLASVA